ncbi:MAG: TetR family transcriptional regulator [Acidimicrobiaceae bacterium]|nr:TetR family transcriptional regulator [Acidimicrobiaceae bacterium]
MNTRQRLLTAPDASAGGAPSWPAAPVATRPATNNHRAAPPASLSLSELVERTGVPASTIHHYRRLSLIPPPDRAAANRFVYDERHVEALRLIRTLRERRGLSLDEIAQLLPELLTSKDTTLEGDDGEPADARQRVVAAAIEAFQTRSYAEVAVSDIAEAAGVAKGSVYRHFAAKEDLFRAAIEQVLEDTADDFAQAVDALGGASGIAHDPGQTALVFAGLVAKALPLLLELGARAAKGFDEAEDNLARRVLRTLASAAGRPLARPGEDPVVAGLSVIQSAFATVLGWAVGPDWPPDADDPRAEARQEAARARAAERSSGRHS